MSEFSTLFENLSRLLFLGSFLFSFVFLVLWVVSKWKSLGRSKLWAWGMAACVLLMGLAFMAPRAVSEFVIEPAGGALTSSGSSYDRPGPVLPQSLPKRPARAPSAAPAGGGPPPSEPDRRWSSQRRWNPERGADPFVDAQTDNLSTFAVDVDTGSYTLTRSYLNYGRLPDPYGVRVEEFLNYFDYDYPKPGRGRSFSAVMEAAPTPFGPRDSTLFRVGVRGRSGSDDDRRPVSLILVMDASGSMAQGGRIAVAHRVAELLVDSLQHPEDRVAVVAYDTNAWVPLHPVWANEGRRIRRAIDEVRPDGSTNVEEGLQAGFDLADGEVDGRRNVRVVLISDGVANVGNTDPAGILRSAREYSVRRVYLSAVGVGFGDYNDVLLEQLADNGDGSYRYVNDMDEAEDVFREGIPGILEVIARDAKIQVEFNPAVVSRYRLIGYENREVADEDFRQDDVDAGEIGAGHSVTALYELELSPGGRGLLATVQLRYEDPEKGGIVELAWDFDRSEAGGRFEKASPEFRLAVVVAQWAELLRASDRIGSSRGWSERGSFSGILSYVDDIRDDLGRDRRVREFAGLVERSVELVGERRR